MPTPTYTPLANITLSGSASSVSFTSLNQSYKDLILIVDAIGSANGNINMTFNDSSTSSNSLRISGNGTAASSSSYTGPVLTLTSIAYPRTDSRCLININIMDYATTNKHKTSISRANNGAYGTDFYVGRWPDNTAINKITISGSFAATTTLALYGVIS